MCEGENQITNHFGELGDYSKLCAYSSLNKNGIPIADGLCVGCADAHYESCSVKEFQDEPFILVVGDDSPERTKDSLIAKLNKYEIKKIK